MQRSGGSKDGQLHEKGRLEDGSRSELLMTIRQKMYRFTSNQTMIKHLICSLTDMS